MNRDVIKLKEQSTSKDEIKSVNRENFNVQDFEEIKKRLENKIEVLTNIVLQKEQIIETLKNENIKLKERIEDLETSISSKIDTREEDSEFIEKSRIEIIVKNSHEAEEIKRYIEALEKCNWSIRAAAKLLNIPHSTFHYRLKKLNLLKNK